MLDIMRALAWINVLMVRLGIRQATPIHFHTHTWTWTHHVGSILGRPLNTVHAATQFSVTCEYSFATRACRVYAEHSMHVTSLPRTSTKWLRGHKWLTLWLDATTVINVTRVLCATESIIIHSSYGNTIWLLDNSDVQTPKTIALNARRLCVRLVLDMDGMGVVVVHFDMEKN